MSDIFVLSLLAIAIVILALAVTALVATLPFLWWKVSKHEEKIDKLDEVTADFLDAVAEVQGRKQ